MSKRKRSLNTMRSHHRHHHHHDLSQEVQGEDWGSVSRKRAMAIKSERDEHERERLQDSLREGSLFSFLFKLCIHVHLLSIYFPSISLFSSSWSMTSIKGGVAFNASKHKKSGMNHQDFLQYQRCLCDLLHPSSPLSSPFQWIEKTWIKRIYDSSSFSNFYHRL